MYQAFGHVELEVRRDSAHAKDCEGTSMHTRARRAVSLSPAKEGHGKAGTSSEQPSFWDHWLRAGSPSTGPEMPLESRLVQSCVLVMAVLRKPEKVTSCSVNAAEGTGTWHYDQKKW